MDLKREQFVDLLDAPFSRRGSYFALCNDNLKAEDVLGKSQLWLCNTRSVDYAMTDITRPNNFRQILLQAVLDGQNLPCVLDTTPEEVVIRTMRGSIRFCIGTPRLMLAKGTDGLSLRVTPRPDWMSGQTSVPIAPGVHDVEFGPARLRVTALRGELRALPGALEIAPDAGGEVLVAFEDHLVEPPKRSKEDYPDYESHLRHVTEEFERFCAAVCPGLPVEFEPKRLQALWQTWSLMAEPDGENDYRRPMVKMMHSIFESAFGWQMPMQAVWLSRDPKLAWEIFCSPFEFQDANGRLSDAVGFKALPGKSAMKPPIHGMVLLWLMEQGVIDAAAPDMEARKWLLERLIAWTEYFFRFRSEDGVLCAYQRVLETGWEDAPQYRGAMPQLSPDLNTYLALSLEAIARFGAAAGLDAARQQEYLARSGAVIERMLDTLWDGERWFSLCTANGARSRNDNIVFAMPLLLGERIPREVREKTVGHLFRAGGFESPVGMTTEALDSLYLRHGFSAGSVITPTHFFLPPALEQCGRADLARRVALSYCRALRDRGFFHIFNPLTGREDRSLTAFGEKQLFWSAWTSSCYLFLADRYGRE